MSGSTILGRSLRLLPKTKCKAPEHSLRPRSLYFQHRQYSQWETFLKASDSGDRKPSKLSTVTKPFKTKHHLNGHFWKLDLASSTGSVSYYAHSGAKPTLAHRAWLRDSCCCHKCVDSSSGQKRFASSDVPDELPIRTLAIAEDGSLQVHWEKDFFTHDTHISEYPHNLWHKAVHKRYVGAILAPKLWNRDIMKQLSPIIPYQAFMAGNSEYRQAMTTLSEYGLIFLRDVPFSEDAVTEIVEKIGVLQNTFYGRTWDVRSKPNAENVAYTNSFLGLHQDLLYMRNAPRIQLLHCLKNTCLGGESLFSDGYHVAEQFRQQFAGMVKPLNERKVVYHYNKSGNIYRRPRAVLSKLGVYWSPPFQSPVQSDSMTNEGMDNYAQWLKAARKMQQLLEDEVNMYEYKMQPGECVIFDNRRILHGRRQFDTSSGERWLKGAYVEDDSHNSLLASLGLFGEYE
ncbi:Clavaminate synthase-like protein [Xylariaceae sp. AK1471]|nr:Clavaminate synthase-like protein [Xylariaceae sp. AK1471]